MVTDRVCAYDDEIDGGIREPQEQIAEIAVELSILHRPRRV